MRHPIEAYLGPALLQLFEHPAKRARLFSLAQESRKQQKQLQAQDPGGQLRQQRPMLTTPKGINPLQPPFADSAFLSASVILKADRLSSGFSAIAASSVGGPRRAGGHAAYLTWLISEIATRISFSTGCFSCFAKKRLPGEPLTESQRKAAIRVVFLTGLKFSRFKHLPLSMDHKYWHQFQIRDLPAWGMQPQGLPAVGRPVQDLPRYGYDDSSYCPGCCRGNNRCCCSQRGFYPYDMAYLPVMLPLSLHAWDGCGGGGD
jgi:hypothetical protein